MTNFELNIKRPGRSAKRRRFSGPSDWSEVSPRHAIGLMRLRAILSTRTDTGTSEALFAGLHLLYGLRPRHQRWLFDAHFLRTIGLNADESTASGETGAGDGEREMTLKLGQSLIDTIRWIGETDPGTRFIVPSFRLFDFRFGTLPVLLGRLRHREVYYAPADALGDSTFEEFASADKAYRDRNLPMLAAILYRPGQAGERESLNPKSLKVRAARFAHLEPALLHLIAEHYESTKQYLQSCFKHVFPKNLASDEEKAKKADKGGNWLDVAISMAKLDATKIREIEQLNLYLALKVLNEQLRQAEEMEAAVEKMRKPK